MLVSIEYRSLATDRVYYSYRPEYRSIKSVIAGSILVLVFLLKRVLIFRFSEEVLFSYRGIVEFRTFAQSAGLKR